MRKLILLSSFYLLFFVGHVSAAIPEGYYDTADAKNGNTLRNTLKNIVTDGHFSISYNQIWTAFATTDIHPVTGLIYDMYSNCTFTLGTSQCGRYSPECDCYIN